MTIDSNLTRFLNASLSNRTTEETVGSILIDATTSGLLQVASNSL